MRIEFKMIAFILATICIVWVSRSSIRNRKYHGFYRFFAWETILVLFLVNMDFWFVDPFSIRQLFAWLFLILSLVLILLGVLTFQRHGKVRQERADPALVGIEKTTELVTVGIYKTIRHPFYSSLLFLGWGIMLKNIGWQSILLVGITTVLLLITAKKEEMENIEFFGGQYQTYMSETKMFIPFIL